MDLFLGPTSKPFAYRMTMTVDHIGDGFIRPALLMPFDHLQATRRRIGRQGVLDAFVKFWIAAEEVALE